MKICTTNCKQIIDGVRNEFPYPITYNKKPTPKQKYSIKKLYDVDMLSFGSDIGHVTNCSTYWWSLLYNYDKDSIEYKEIVRRLKLMRQQQGNSIDKSKGIIVSPMPSYFTNYNQCENELDKKLVANKKPYFQKYIYPKLAMEYDTFYKLRETYSLLKYNCKWEDNMDENFIQYMEYKNPVLDNESIMNYLCHYMESQIKEIKRNYKKQDLDIVRDILIDKSVDYNEYEIDLFNDLLKEYKMFKRNEKNNFNPVTNSSVYNKQKKYYFMCQKIKKKAYELIDNKIKIANLAVIVGYQGIQEENKDFCWTIFGEEVFNNVKNNQHNNVYIPKKTLNNEYDFEYLGDKFEYIRIEDIDDNI